MIIGSCFPRQSSFVIKNCGLSKVVSLVSSVTAAALLKDSLGQPWVLSYQVWFERAFLIKALGVDLFESLLPLSALFIKIVKLLVLEHCCPRGTHHLFVWDGLAYSPHLLVQVLYVFGRRKLPCVIFRWCHYFSVLSWATLLVCLWCRVEVSWLLHNYLFRLFVDLWHKIESGVLILWVDNPGHLLFLIDHPPIHDQLFFLAGSSLSWLLSKLLWD